MTGFEVHIIRYLRECEARFGGVDEYTKCMLMLKHIATLVTYVTLGTGEPYMALMNIIGLSYVWLKDHYNEDTPPLPTGSD